MPIDPLANSEPEQEIIEKILDEYEQAIVDGNEFSLAEACRNWPHLLPKLEAQLNALRKIDEQLNATVSEVADFRKYLKPSSRPGWLGRLHHYELEAVLGHGAFGIVVKAFDEKLHRAVAIKIMRPEFAATSPPRKRFLREARAAAAITHENIVAIYAVEEEPIPYLVMEYISGGTVQRWMDNNGPFEPSEVLRIGQQIAAGLAAAHAVQLIHRDIKPANILLMGTPIERVKISDFGLARAVDDASLTASGLIAGTPMYMSPEQARGEPLDHRSDLFSLGSVLYVLASGRPPFRAANTVAVLKRVCEATPRGLEDVLPGTPSWLETIIFKLLEKERKDRYQTAQEVAELLARCQTELEYNGKVTCVQSRVRPADPQTLKTVNSQSKGVGVKKLPRSWLFGGVVVIGTLVGFLWMNSGSLLDHREVDEVPQRNRSNQSAEVETATSPTAVTNDNSNVLGDRDFFQRLHELGAEVSFFGLEGRMTASLRRAMKDMGNDNWMLIDSSLLGESPNLMLEGNLFVSFRGQSFDDAQLAEVVRLMNLRPSGSPGLNIQMNATSVTSDGVKELSTIHLNTLGLNDSRLDEDAVNSLSRNKPSGTLIIANGGLSDRDVERLVENSTFIWLHIPGNQITHRSLARIAQSNVSILNVGENNLSDADIAPLSKHSNLRGLYLTGNPISDAGLEHLRSLQLTDLFLERTQVTADGIARLHRELTNCRITWDGGMVAPGNTFIWPSDQPAPAIAPFTAEEAKQHQENWANHLGASIEFENSIGMKFRLIPPGEFQMGTDEKIVDFISDMARDRKTSDFWYPLFKAESPRHKVTLPRPFTLATYEVTNEQFVAFLRETSFPWDFFDDATDKAKVISNLPPSAPVANISWNDAKAFCAWLSTKEGRVYRLPTEAEWEFACRAGNDGWHVPTSDNYLPGEIKPIDESFTYLLQYANVIDWSGPEGKRRGAEPVGSRKPNAFGLFDMHGNVWEWCQDVFLLYPGSDRVDPVATSDSDYHILRGGSFVSDALECRPSTRFYRQASDSNVYYGFRVVQEISPDSHSKESAEKRRIENF